MNLWIISSMQPCSTVLCPVEHAHVWLSSRGFERLFTVMLSMVTTLPVRPSKVLPFLLQNFILCKLTQFQILRCSEEISVAPQVSLRKFTLWQRPSSTLLNLLAENHCSGWPLSFHNAAFILQHQITPLGIQPKSRYINVLTTSYLCSIHECLIIGITCLFPDRYPRPRLFRVGSQSTVSSACCRWQLHVSSMAEAVAFQWYRIKA